MFRLHCCRVLPAAVAFTCVAAAGMNALATQRLVPSQYGTIQAAINASTNGDEIVVSPGLYNEAVTVNRAVTITGLNPENPLVSLFTVISGNGADPAVTVASHGTTLKGLTIQEGSEGVTVWPSSSAAIYKCLIQGNYGTGVEMQYGSGTTTVSFCWVINNYSCGIRASSQQHPQRRGLADRRKRFQRHLDVQLRLYERHSRQPDRRQ